MCAAVALGVSAAKQAAHRKGDTAVAHSARLCAVFEEVQTTTGPNLPAVFGHGLLLSMQSLMRSLPLFKALGMGF